MRRRVSLVLAGLVFALLACTPTRAMAVPTTVTVVMEPTQVSMALGGRFTLETEVTNTGTASTGRLLAHLNIASIQGSVYVDPEDWAGDRSQEFELQPGETRRLSWQVQAVNSGRFGGYVVVLPFDQAAAAAEALAVSPLVKIAVAPRSTLNAGESLPAVLVVPALLGILAATTRLRLRRRH
jgi:uncharacterized cupredoxin-like copper-binding protein